MGYSTDFYGGFEISPPLNEKEINFLLKFSDTRRVERNVDSNGRYYITNGNDNYGQDGANILKNNTSFSQPGLWCGFHASEDGRFLEWNGGEKTYDGASWIRYIITHFLGNHPLMEKINPELYELHGFTPHVLNGVMYARGEELLDVWKLVVEDNEVFVQEVDQSNLPDEFKKLVEPQDPDSDEDTDEYDDEMYDAWSGLADGDFHIFSFKEKALVPYESNEVVEQELANIQETMRATFVKDFKDALVMVENIAKNSKPMK